MQEQNIYNMIPLPITLFIMSSYLDNYNSASTPTYFQLDSWILYTIKSIFEIHFAKINRSDWSFTWESLMKVSLLRPNTLRKKFFPQKHRWEYLFTTKWLTGGLELFHKLINLKGISPTNFGEENKYFQMFLSPRNTTGKTSWWPNQCQCNLYFIFYLWLLISVIKLTKFKQVVFISDVSRSQLSSVDPYQQQICLP